MILDIIVTVSDIYRTIMLPTTTTNTFSPVPIIWLPHCLKQIRSVFTVLMALDLPNEALNKISCVIFDLRFDINYKKKKMLSSIEFVINHCHQITLLKYFIQTSI